MSHHRSILSLLALSLFFATGAATVLAQPSAQPATPAKSAVAAAEPAWPQVVTSGTTTLTIYQPQLDSWDGYTLQARAAVAATDKSGKSTYGIVYFSAHTLVDKATRWVVLDQYQITKTDFPDTEKQADTWVATLQKDAANRKKTISLDQLEAAMGVMAAEKKADSQPIENTPPTIITSESPALLVYVDGDPAYRAVPDSALQRVINTRPLLLKDAQGKHYLHVFDGWMVADSLTGTYAPLTTPNADLEKVKKAAIENRQIDLLTGQTDPKAKAPTLAKGPVPAIHVATTPTELIVTDGAAQWQPIQGTQLLYVANTTGHIFKEIGDQSSYVLISGRWFRATDMKGPWNFVAADKLPADFANIPDDSPKENVKASVAGTPQAQEAAIAANIPQTSVIKKSEVKMSPPQFDGAPQLKPITGTSLQYVANTATPIIKVDAQHWYAVENGVWFVAPSDQGPWEVATSVPAVIYSIPPSSPMHYITYVKVYNATGDTVIVGYTPGYQGSTIDPASGVVVYGTGYPYTPWVGSVWYGPPVTYGFGVAIRYTPWTGWTFGFGFGWSWGASTTVAMGWGWGAYPWWGPYGWGYAWGPRIYPAPLAWGGVAYGYHGGAVAWGPGGWAGTTGNIYRQWGSRASVSRYASGYNAWTGNRWAGQVGASYNSRTGISAAGQRGAVHNVYSGNYAAGGRGVAVGPNGAVVAGAHGTVGNTRTGAQISGNRGAVYNPNTGNTTRYAGVHGKNGSAANIGGNVYAGHDGQVYKKTDNGWQSVVKGSTRATPASNPTQLQNLNRESAARSAGNQRLNDYRSSSQLMNHSYGGGGGGIRHR